MIKHRPGRHRIGVRGLVVSVAFAVIAVLAVLVARSSDDRVADPGAGAKHSTSSTVTSVPPSTTPPVIIGAARPSGAAEPGTAEWYTAAAPGGRLVTLGVYRPVGRPTGTVLVLGGADGLRRQYEDLAARFSARGYIAVVGAGTTRVQPAVPRTRSTVRTGPHGRG